MTRAKGRNTARQGSWANTDSPEDRNIGESVRQDPDINRFINSGTGNISHREVTRQTVAKEPENRSQFEGMMAHGVPNVSDGDETLARRERGDGKYDAKVVKSEPVIKPSPVPVYIVEEGSGKVIRTAYPRNITVPGTGNDPVRLCGRDPRRVKIGLLNESTTTNVRFTQGIAEASQGLGALLPWPSTSYLFLETQDELYSLSVSSTAATVSIIETFEQES